MLKRPGAANFAGVSKIATIYENNLVKLKKSQKNKRKYKLCIEK